MLIKQKKKCLTSASLMLEELGEGEEMMEMGMGPEPHHLLDTVDAIAFIDPSGDETEEIEDLRMIKRGTNFPMPPYKKKSKKGSH